MVDIVFVANLGAALFAVAFMILYLRIILRAEEIGPAPMSWVLAAVGSALIGASAVLEAVLAIQQISLVFHVEKVYFMLGNAILMVVLFRLWRSVGGARGA